MKDWMESRKERKSLTPEGVSYRSFYTRVPLA
jgi:hypothetical protein